MEKPIYSNIKQNNAVKDHVFSFDDAKTINGPIIPADIYGKKISPSDTTILFALSETTKNKRDTVNNTKDAIKDEDGIKKINFKKFNDAVPQNFLDAHLRAISFRKNSNVLDAFLSPHHIGFIFDYESAFQGKIFGLVDLDNHCKKIYGEIKEKLISLLKLINKTDEKPDEITENDNKYYIPLTFDRIKYFFYNFLQQIEKIDKNFVDKNNSEQEFKDYYDIDMVIEKGTEKYESLNTIFNNVFQNNDEGEPTFVLLNDKNNLLSGKDRKDNLAQISKLKIPIKEKKYNFDQSFLKKIKITQNGDEKTLYFQKLFEKFITKKTKSPLTFIYLRIIFHIIGVLEKIQKGERGILDTKVPSSGKDKSNEYLSYLFCFFGTIFSMIYIDYIVKQGNAINTSQPHLQSSTNFSFGGMRAIKYKTLTKKNRKLRKRSQRKNKKGHASYKFYTNKSKRRSYRRSRRNRK